MRSFVIAGVLIIFYLMQLLLQEKALRHVDGDGSGYYAYLPALFVYKSADFKPVYEAEKKRHSLDYMAHYFHPMNGALINKFYMGTALMILPFFLLAMLFSWISGMPLDGYNIIFQYAVALAAASWLAVGLLALRRLLLTYNINKTSAVITITMIALGTNLFHYAFLQPSHSHVYSFTAIALFLLYARLYFLRLKPRYLSVAALIFGLVLLIRPSNGLILFALPFIAGRKEVFINGFNRLLQEPKLLMRAAVLSSLVLGLQVLYNFSLTGKLFLWTYQNEGFNFASPAFFAFLFSFRKGFFIYTPLMLLSLIGLGIIWKQSRWAVFTFISFFLLLVYVLSSWWNWFYGDSFGMRPMVDFYALFAIPLAFLTMNILESRWLSAFLLPLFIFFTTLNLFQTWQYKAGIIHPDAMNAEKYKYVFLKWGDQYRNIFGGNAEPLYGKSPGSLLASYENSMEHSRDPWTSNGIQFSDEAFSGSYLAQMNQSNIYSPTLVLQQSDFPNTVNDVYVKAALKYRENEPGAAQDALLVYAVSDRNQQVLFYKTFRIKQMPDTISGQWRTFETGFRVPAWDDSTYEIKVYVWNKERKRFQLDDMEFSFYTVDEL